jgi:CubicO group peptidase (beta-lactamase class C family)
MVFTIRTRWIGLATLICATIAALAAPALAVDAAKSPNRDVARVLRQYEREGQISGATTLVSDRESTYCVMLGCADLQKHTPVRDSTLFGIMSMTKPITATALMILVDEGKVAVDDPVEKYIPAFAHSKLKNGEPVYGLKIRHLLTHTSGLFGKQDCEDSLEATANMLAARPFDFQPGENWKYSPGMNVVGRIIEVASRQPYEQFLRERIFEPLGMHQTTFHPMGSQRRRIAALYQLGKGDKSLLPAERWSGIGEPNCVPNPSGGIFTTGGDLERFYRMILNHGMLDGKRILSANAVRQMTTVQTGDLKAGFVPGMGWGLGWGIVREPQGVTGMLSPGTFGHGGAYGTQAWIDPVKDRIYLLLFQRSDLGNSEGSDLRRDFQQAAADALNAN